MSGYLAGATQFALPDHCRATRVLHCHGTADPMVAFAMAEKTAGLLREQGVADYALTPYAGMAHTVTPGEIQVQPPGGRETVRRLNRTLECSVA